MAAEEKMKNVWRYKNMKKLAMILAVCLAAMCVLTACSKQEAPAQPAGDSVDTQAVDTQADDAVTSEGDAEGAFAGLANPVVESDAETILNTLGLSFGEVADAENVRYSIINNELAQMEYTKDGTEFCVRMSAANEFTDISGMCYTWEITEDCDINGRAGKTMRVKDGDKTIDVCEWYDVAPGIMYSVSAVAPDLDGFDITAVAEQLFAPMQGDAE